MAGVVGLSAMTRGLAATADDTSDRSGAKITQAGQLSGHEGTLLFEFGERVWHGTYL